MAFYFLSMVCRYFQVQTYLGRYLTSNDLVRIPTLYNGLRIFVNVYFRSFFSLVLGGGVYVPSSSLVSLPFLIRCEMEWAGKVRKGISKWEFWLKRGGEAGDCGAKSE